MRMPWAVEYLETLKARDLREHASRELFDHYTKLADKRAREGAISTVIAPAEKAERDIKNDGQVADVLQLRVELAAAQRSRTELQDQLASASVELERLRVKSTADGRKISELSAEKTALVVKLRDREEEIRGKAKLLQDVHDETVSLTLQFNMSEDQNAKLRKENDELVARWMARVGEEAEAMNTASRFS